MRIPHDRARVLLQSGNLAGLFEELGWDRATQKLSLRVDEQDFTLAAFARKSGFTAWLCECADGRVPLHATRLKIDRKLTEISFEHLIVFVTASRERQLWMWVRREAGKPLAPRLHEYFNEQRGDALLQKLDNLYISFEEEEAGINITDVYGRARAAFDVERITKQFYREFDAHRKAFVKFIAGIQAIADREWYASVMLNRLMFVYFIQRKHFLDDDRDYLRQRLLQCQQEHGRDRFGSFYRYFLRRLFHEGFGRRQEDRSADFEKLLGRIPYLNGGLFEMHELERPERYGKSLDIPDEAFTRLFDFFDRWQWHLDENPLRSGDEINPDVLGHIFEKYINQKELGAYYTKEDITDYISKSTLLPFLLEAARAKCKVAFDNPDGPTVWDHLRRFPDRYLYPSVRHGVERPLPAEIEKGLASDQPGLLQRRGHWNRSAPPEFGLPSETWREVVARRQRCAELRRKLDAGEVREARDLITLNLDLRQFVQDVIAQCEGPDLLRALWHALEKITVLDPTCGSGAFLFAVLNLLEPLYESCLDRMRGFVDDLDRSATERRPEKFADFRAVLARVEQHPNQRYFIFKSIILKNLYGVDLMEEAVEICKLRLFLKLAAQVSPDRNKDNLGIEPLPDIDFNIRAGNTLVGYATYAEVERSVTSSFDFENAMGKISQRAADLQHASDRFRRRQTEGDGSVPLTEKQELQKRLAALRDELNRYLASDYGVDVRSKAALAKWTTVHQPFHWFVEFHGILAQGGFDVIVGNPPYLESREIDYEVKGLKTTDSGAVHAMCVERSVALLGAAGTISMIVPLSLPSTQRMADTQRILENSRSLWLANYAWRPAKLFDTVNRALTIFVAVPHPAPASYSTGYQKWTSENRERLFERLNYVTVSRERPAFWIPKLGNELERAILAKYLAAGRSVGHFLGRTNHRVYYRTTGGLYWKVFTDFPPAFRLNGKDSSSTRETWLSTASEKHVRPLIAVLSSDLFWWWYTITSNLRDLNPYDLHHFPLPESALTDPKLRRLGERYLTDITANSTMLAREQRQTGRTETQSFKIQKSKGIIDTIDAALAPHYGLTDEELDFVVNYDIKYRIRNDGQDDD